MGRTRCRETALASSGTVTKGRRSGLESQMESVSGPPQLSADRTAARALPSRLRASSVNLRWKETKDRPSHLTVLGGRLLNHNVNYDCHFPSLSFFSPQRASQPPSRKIIIKRAVSGFLRKYACHGGLSASISCMELHFVFCVRDHIYVYVRIGMCASFIIPPRFSFFFFPLIFSV